MRTKTNLPDAYSMSAQTDDQMSRHLGPGQGFSVRRIHALLFCLPLLAAPVWANAVVTDITELSLEQLLDVSIIGASKYEQKQDKVAAAVSVITRNEIKAFGWRTLNDALASLPGIHTTYDRQYSYLGTRGFGLPGDYNTRVLRHRRRQSVERCGVRRCRRLGGRCRSTWTWSNASNSFPDRAARCMGRMPCSAWST